MAPGGGHTEAATKDPEASESLLEAVTVTSPDSPDDQGHLPDGGVLGHAGQTEDQPLINRTTTIPTVIKPASGTPKFQPKSFRRQSQGLPASATPTRSSRPKIPSSSLELDRPTIPIMINLDPSERVSLNAGKKKNLV